MTRVILTGAGGFVGSHVLEHLLTVTPWDIIATDSFRHKGKTDRISLVLEGHAHWRPRVKVITHDLSAPLSEQTVYQAGHIDYIIAVASESHVDRSIKDPVPFIRNNVNVALTTLEYAREVKPKAVIWVSTDEVYGPEPVVNGVPVPQEEWAPILPSSPYSSSKACQEAIAFSYWRTYGVPVTIINIMNIFGERQDPEKFIPMLIRRISAGEPVTIHGSKDEMGTRHYLHARNAADAIVHILSELPPAAYPKTDRPSRYNVVGPDRISNLDLAYKVAKIIGRPLNFEFVDFQSARPGHDAHYGLNPAKLTAAGWKPPVDFEESLSRTVRWSLSHEEWIRFD